MSSNRLAESLIYDKQNNSLQILNQLLLPVTVEYEHILNSQDAWNAIKLMKVRGAPAIAILGLLSVAVELGQESVLQPLNKSIPKLVDYIKNKADYLCTSRPTAVNIRKEFDYLIKKVDQEVSQNRSFDELVEFVIEHCFGLLQLDRDTNKAIGDHGAQHILLNAKRSKVNVLTHCNTGSLATAGYGTALGVIRSLNATQSLEQAYCTETRPYNQGARLTAWELLTENIPSTLVCDDMVAWLMANKQIDAVVVGADRVVANGDTANKIGTFQISILCKHFGVPFYVASPRSTLDMSKANGQEIVIEERPEVEMKFVGSVQIAPTGMKCWNPSFDVTPAELITGGIITELGVYSPAQLKQVFANS